MEKCLLDYLSRPEYGIRQDQHAVALYRGVHLERYVPESVVAHFRRKGYLDENNRTTPAGSRLLESHP